MPFPRSSGILLHPTSLPSRGGIGDFGPAAYEFLDFLVASGQSLWQVLPLGPTGIGNSPYSATSAFAGNPLCISLERLADETWISQDRLRSLPGPTKYVDYPAVQRLKMPLLREAAGNFLQHAGAQQRGAFERFCAEHRAWLEDFVLFDVLRQRFKDVAWNTWPAELVRRDPAALEKVRRDAARELEIERVIQFVFFKQWAELHAACRQRGIRVVGDVAIFVSYDSAEVWRHPEIFHLRPDGSPEFVAGVPPDAFSKTGQRWGNPLYRWPALKARGYDWWIERMRMALRLCDILRLDHFRGFEQYWEIPGAEPTAVNGRWVHGPGDDLFIALRNALGELPLVAEDLGHITPEVHALRDRFAIPGMRVMQFGFGDEGAQMYLPHRFHPNVVVYTGTHDNDTTLGWWRNHASEHERSAASAYFAPLGEAEVNWAFIRAAIASVAVLCVIPLQDVLGLGSEARMNTPSHPDGNWRWRYLPQQLNSSVAGRLAELSAGAGRIPSHPPQSAGGEQGQRKAAENLTA